VYVVAIAVRVFVGVKTELGHAYRVRERIRKLRGVKAACTIYSGPYDVIVTVDVPDLRDYETLALYEIPRIHGVVDYESFLTAGPDDKDAAGWTRDPVFSPSEK
jgi:DNA-binding Lrp family transcriptional regulator